MSPIAVVRATCRRSTGDFSMPLPGERACDRTMHAVLPQPGELLAQLSSGSGVIRHRAIITLSRLRSRRRAVRDVTS